MKASGENQMKDAFGMVMLICRQTRKMVLFCQKNLKNHNATLFKEKTKVVRRGIKKSLRVDKEILSITA